MIDYGNEKIKPFADIWRNKPPSPIKHGSADWDKRAGHWEKALKQDSTQKKQSDARINKAVSFLKSHGLLGADQDIIDIGCGPGRFAAEFARTAHHVTGTDLSPGMIENAGNFAKEQGLDNTEFVNMDFIRADIDALKWRRRFDLAFASITPAVSTLEDLDKMMSLSRGWCCYGGFRRRTNEIEDRVASELYRMKTPMNRDGRSSYALFNMLWLSGYDPHVEFHYDEREDVFGLDSRQAALTAERMGPVAASENERSRIRKFLESCADSDGMIHSVTREAYVWILWDIRK